MTFMITSLLYHLYIIIHNRLKNPCAVPPLYEKKNAQYIVHLASTSGGRGGAKQEKKKTTQESKKRKKKKKALGRNCSSRKFE